MKWPKKVLRITYSIRIDDKTRRKIIQIDRETNNPLDSKLEHIQGTVRAEYGLEHGSWIYITVTVNADHQNYWEKIETVINNHLK